MTKKSLAQKARLGLVLLLTIPACLMVPFFNDPSPAVALIAMTAWACLLVAIYKVPPSRGPEE